jgi:hypothetical protein
MIRKSAGFTRAIVTVTIANGNATKLPHRFHRSLAVSPVVAALWAARFAQRSGYRNCNAKSSVSLVEFAQQLILQISPRSLFDRATLGGYPLLLRLTFAVQQTATRAGSMAGARRCLALLDLRTDP